MEFWTGLVLGLLAGVPLGILMMSLCLISGSRRPKEPARPNLYACADPACGLEEDE